MLKYWYPTANKRLEQEYRRNPKPLLMISDGRSSTRRTFRVVAIDDEGWVVAEAGDDEKPESPGPKPRAGAEPTDPLALVAAIAAAAPPPDQPTLYRWAKGKSLAKLTPVPKDEARKDPPAGRRDRAGRGHNRHRRELTPGTLPRPPGGGSGDPSSLTPRHSLTPISRTDTHAWEMLVNWV